MRNQANRGEKQLRSAAAAYSAVVGVFLGVPIAVVVLLSFSSSRYLQVPPPGWSLRWYEQLVSDPSWVESAVLSAKVALAVAPVATLLGLGLAAWLSRNRSAWARLAWAFVLSPQVVPAVVSAVGFTLLFGRLKLVETAHGLFLAHTALALPVATLVLSAALGRAHADLELAALTLGASPIQAFASVTVPQIRSALVASLLLCFIVSFDEPVVAIFIAGTDAVTLPKRMWDGIQYEIDPTTAAASVLLIVLGFVVALVADLAARRST